MVTDFSFSSWMQQAMLFLRTIKQVFLLAFPIFIGSCTTHEITYVTSEPPQLQASQNTEKVVLSYSSKKISEEEVKKELDKRFSTYVAIIADVEKSVDWKSNAGGQSTLVEDTARVAAVISPNTNIILLIDNPRGQRIINCPNNVFYFQTTIFEGANPTFSVWNATSK